MYATDCEIRSLLDEMNVETRLADIPFEPDSQIQPCSIDVRLDAVFWKPFRSPTLWLPWRRQELDLRRERLLEASPRRHWRRLQLRPGETVLLKPGQMLLGRVYEELTIPNRCAGKLEGRSSYARMGLSVHCTGDFINPAWRGHMPLELFNSGKSSIRLVPYLPICQIMLVRLADEPERTYGHDDLGSKYIPDDGGPSYWWRDKIVKDLLKRLGEVDLAIGMQERILAFIGEPEYAILERLERYVASRKLADIESVDSLVESFARSEDRSRRRDNLLRRVARGALPFFLALFIGSFFVDTIGWGQILLGFAVVLSIPVTVYSFLKWDIGPFFGERELLRRRQEAAQQHVAQ